MIAPYVPLYTCGPFYVLRDAEHKYCIFGETLFGEVFVDVSNTFGEAVQAVDDLVGYRLCEIMEDGR